MASSAAEKTTATKIAPARGKLGVMIVGMGAVATTFVAGVEAIRKGIAKPIGSLTQMGTIRLGKRTDNRSPKINKFVPLANLKDLVFTAWDIFEEDAYAAAINAGVLEKDLLNQIKPFMRSIKPRKAVFDRNYVKLLDGKHVKKGKNSATWQSSCVRTSAISKRSPKQTGCDDLVRVHGKHLPSRAPYTNLWTPLSVA